MSDISPVYPVTDWGSIMSSMPTAQSNIRSQTVQQEATAASVPNTQADTALKQQQTQAANLQNQKQQIILDLFRKNAMAQQAPAQNDSMNGAPSDVVSGLGKSADASGASPTAAAATGAGESVDTDGKIQPRDAISHSQIADLAEKKYAVRDIWTPQEVQQLADQPNQRLLGLPDNTENIIKQHQARITSQTNQANLAASSAYDQLAGVAGTVKDPSYTPGMTLAALARTKPNGPDDSNGATAAARVSALAKKNGWTPEQTDEYVSQYATEASNQIHRWTGRDIEVRASDNAIVDKQTQQELPGALPVGISPNEYRQTLVEGLKPMDIKNSDGSSSQVATWVGLGFHSDKAYADSATAARGLASAASARSTANNAAATAPPAKPGAATPAAGGAAPTAAPAPTTHAAPATTTTDPVLKTALADKNYNVDTPPVKANSGQTPEAAEDMKNLSNRKNALMEDGKAMTAQGAQSLTFLQAAKAVLDSGGTPTGLAAPFQVAVSRALSALNLGPGDYAAHYQEVAKYLGNSAVEGLKNISNRPSTKELQIQMQDLNPNLDMQDSANRNLIDKNIHAAQYAIDSAHRIPAYLLSHKEPGNFYDWNQQYWPRAETVNKTDAKAAPAGAAPVKVKSPEEAKALPAGTKFITPDGETRTRH